MRAGIFLIAMAVASSLQAQEHADRGVSGGGTLPAGWAARTDRGTGMDDVRLEETSDGLKLTLGPRVIVYREQDVTGGDFSVSATFDQLAQFVHAEAYGLFIGGRDLQGSDQVYLYFLIRGTGDVLVKRRLGNRTANVGPGWAASDAVDRADDQGRSTNTLEVSVTGGTVSFRVNGTEVFSQSAEGLDTDGIVGIRANHNLDLVIREFTIR
ncbi:MAG: hypothetical protein ACE5FJ_04345 [Gemmatimonadales bacterium]